jgi:hypothetical protein
MKTDSDQAAAVALVAPEVLEALAETDPDSSPNQRNPPPHIAEGDFP